jgi:hypothetical protein
MPEHKIGTREEWQAGRDEPASTLAFAYLRSVRDLLAGDLSRRLQLRASANLRRSKPESCGPLVQVRGGKARQNRQRRPLGIQNDQVWGARCTAGHTRAPRIRNPVTEGTTRQAKAPALGLRWDSFRVRKDCPVGTRSAHSRRAVGLEIPIR